MSASRPAYMLSRFEALENKLEASGKGFHKTSRWWRETIRRFYLSTKKQLVLRCGRRAGKSSTLCRVAVLEALYGDHKIPAGDTGFVVFVSHTRGEAADRLKTIVTILDAIGVKYERNKAVIQIVGRRVGFKVLTGSIAGVSGPTAFLIIGDEVSKWQDKETGANPATEVLASLRPTIATQANAKIILSSSPMTESDAHAKAFTQGDTPFQMVAKGSTWECNPTITEQYSHDLEPDERIWRREYLAEPQAEWIGGFLSDVVDGCIDRDRADTTSGVAEGMKNRRITIAIDHAQVHDEWALAIARSEPQANRAPIVHVERVTGWLPKKGEPLSAENTVREIVKIARSLNVSQIVGDQSHFGSLHSLFQRHGIQYYVVNWTAQSKLERFTTMRSLMGDKRVHLPNEPKVLKQLRSVGVKILPSGIETIAGRGFDDRAFATCLAVTEAIKWAPVGREGDGIPRARVQVNAPSDFQHSGGGMTIQDHMRYGNTPNDTSFGF